MLNLNKIFLLGCWWQEIFDTIASVASGEQSKSEAQGLGE